MTDRASAPWWTSARPPAWALDLLLAVAVAAFQVAVTTMITREDGDEVRPIAVALLAISGLVLAARRPHRAGRRPA